MSLEHISAVKALLSCGPRARTEAANHGTLIMRQSVSVLVVLASKSLDMVLACLDGALLGSLSLVSEHVGLQILERAATVRDWADTLFLVFFAKLVAATTVAMLRSLRVERSRRVAATHRVWVILLCA
jgi:hypothetical protein